MAVPILEHLPRAGREHHRFEEPADGGVDDRQVEGGALRRDTPEQGIDRVE